MASRFLTLLRENWRSGLTVSLVAIPLSVSLAVASGATPAVGIVTAVWAGLVAALFGGSHYNVVGPTGALSGLIAAYAVLHGPESLPALTVVAGIIMLGAYFLRLERFIVFIPSSVIAGFTLGVALIIGCNQINAAFGLSGLARHEHFFANVVESLRHLGQAQPIATVTFATFLAALFALRRAVPKIPGALLLSPLGILLGWLGATGRFPFPQSTLGSVFGTVEFALRMPVTFRFDGDLVVTGAAIALVAILETMLSAKISDDMTHTRHDERREMLGLSLANVASGLAGGIPATAALARTSLNIKTGATHRTSAALHAVFLTLIAFLLLRTFSYIPMSVIAAILTFVAVNMIERRHFAKLYRYQRSGFWLAIAVAAITFVRDPIVGILLGTVVALLQLVEKISHGQYDAKFNRFEQGLVASASGDGDVVGAGEADVLLYSVKGKLAYVNAHAHVQRVRDALDRYRIVIIRLRSVYFMDVDGAEALDQMLEAAKERGRQVCVTSVHGAVAHLLEEVSPHYRELRAAGLVFPKSEDALRHFGVRIVRA